MPPGGEMTSVLTKPLGQQLRPQNWANRQGPHQAAGRSSCSGYRLPRLRSPSVSASDFVRGATALSFVVSVAACSSLRAFLRWVVMTTFSRVSARLPCLSSEVGLALAYGGFCRLDLKVITASEGRAGARGKRRPQGRCRRPTEREKIPPQSNLIFEMRLTKSAVRRRTHTRLSAANKNPSCSCTRTLLS